MSAPPPPHYQNQPQQPYGHQPQQGYGYPPQQPQPQPPRGPQPGAALRMLKSGIVVLAIFGGLAYYVYDYNTSPTGGKAQAEASQSADSAAHDPEIGDCVKVADPKGEPQPTVVDCDSPEAEYKTGDVLYGSDLECESSYDYGIQYSNSHSVDYTLCFTKV
jgi:hypothetical protein